MIKLIFKRLDRNAMYLAKLAHLLRPTTANCLPLTNDAQVAQLSN